MKPVLVVYATREGQSRHIAEHIGEQLAAHQHLFALMDAAHIPESFTISKYSAAIVTASLHMGKHEAEMARFVRRNLAELQTMPSLFLSVSLAEAGVEDPNTTAEKRAEAQAHVTRAIEAFLTDTGWHPTHLAAVAGALRYSKYNFVTRFIMRRIARKQHLPVDTSRDYEFTNWSALDRVVDELLLVNLPG